MSTAGVLAEVPAGVTLLADHSIIDTAPFFLPAFLVVGVVVVLMVRDRRRQRREDEATGTPDGAGDGGPPAGHPERVPVDDDESRSDRGR